MITEIKLNKIASYKNEVTIPDLKKVNFFFGYNGTGKSTIAKYLHNEGKTDTEKSSEFDRCQLTGYDSDENEFLVYDVNFVKRNFIDDDSLKGIFSLNEENEEIEETIIQKQDKKIQIEKYIQKITFLEQKHNRILGDLYNNLLEQCFRKRDKFKIFHKISLEHKNRKNHLKKINQLKNTLGDFNLGIENLSDRYSRYFDKEYSSIKNEVDFNIYFDVLEQEIELNILLEEVIVGNHDVDIAHLIEELNISSWIKQGVDYIEGQTCPFCQENTITQELSEKFTKYFDDSYNKKIEKIQEKLENYKNTTSTLLANLNALANEYNENNISGLLYKELSDWFEKNISIIGEKLEKPNEKKIINDSFRYYISLLKINSKILQHNQELSDLKNHKQSLIDDIWKFMTKESIETIAKYGISVENIGSLLKRIDRSKRYQKHKIKIINQEIDNLREQVVNTRDAVENINKILQQTGFNDFSIEEKETSENNITTYFLKRDNEENIFKSLSEGEKNFIAFLYYYQSCLGSYGRENDKKKIIVIDDPVSSMDSQILFVVTTLIHQLIAKKGKKPDHNDLKYPNIEQVFILTHNIYFYKEVSLKYRPICYNRQHFYVFKKDNKSGIELKREKDVILNDYSLLWISLKSLKEENNGNINNITIYNTMRRVLESYTNFIGINESSSGGWGAIENLDVSDPNYYICSALISEINDASHGSYPLDDLYFQRILNQNPTQLFSAFELIFNNIGKEHYQMMMN